MHSKQTLNDPRDWRLCGFCGEPLILLKSKMKSMKSYSVACKECKKMGVRCATRSGAGVSYNAGLNADIPERVLKAMKWGARSIGR